MLIQILTEIHTRNEQVLGSDCLNYAIMLCFENHKHLQEEA